MCELVERERERERGGEKGKRKWVQRRRRVGEEAARKNFVRERQGDERTDCSVKKNINKVSSACIKCYLLCFDVLGEVCKNNCMHV